MAVTSAEEYKLEPLHVHLIPSQKFKTITMELFLTEKLDRSTITKRTLIPHVLSKGSECYPTNTDLQNHLDDLYGAALQIGGWKTGSWHILNIHVEVANEKFVPGGQGLVKQSLQTLEQALFQPLLEEDGFKEETVDREKEAISRMLQAMKDDQMSFANQRLIDTMASDEPYGIRGYGYEEDLADINGKNLYEYYQKMISQDRMDLFIVGNFDKESMQADVQEVFQTIQEMDHKEASLQEIVIRKAIETEKIVIDRQELQQAKLHIGYRTQTLSSDEDYPALVVYTMMLGGYTGSKLFSEIREKSSLAYYVQASTDSLSDKMIVYSGIAPKDYEKTVEILDEQFVKMREGAFNSEELEQAKAIIISEYLQSQDSATGMIDMYFRQTIGKIKFSPAELISAVKAVTPEDVVRVAKKVQKDTTYLLTEKEV